MVDISEASRWEKHKAGRLIKANEGRGEHGPWLNMVCWKAIFDGEDMQTLVPWIDEDKQDPALKEIGPSVWRVALKCSNQVAALRASGSEDILYWLESSKADEFVLRAFTITKYATIHRYSKQWRNLLLFCWRSFGTLDVNTRFEITDEQHQNLLHLKNHLTCCSTNSPPPSQEITDQLVLSLSLSLIHQEGDRLPTVLKYFSGIVGWDRSARCWKTPSQYTGFLAAIQYIMRVMETADALETGEGTLLQRFRKRRDRWLVIGVTTPFAMVHRQLQYGLCAAQDSPGSDSIRLPNKNEVIYQGRMFEISVLKTLIKDVIRETELILSKLLFLCTLTIPDINPYLFSDDQTVHDLGHYFALEQPQFICEAKVTMYTNLSNNRKDIVGRMTGSTFSGIDAMEYSKNQDKFLVHLALLFIWTSGRTGRGRETLSILFYNKPSALRNLFLLNGQFMTATGYHKGQSITDREKVWVPTMTFLTESTLHDSSRGRLPDFS
jgi:hypothetical protein